MPALTSLHRRRFTTAFFFALLLALSAYFLIEATRVHGRAFASIWFLGIFPAFLCAFICYVGDPDADRRAGFYWRTPIYLVGIVCAGSILIIREGVICLLMLSPIWLVSGWIGAFTLRGMRQRAPNPTVLRCSLLFLPLMTGAIESQFSFPHEAITLTRQAIVHATPAEIWPYAVANADIKDDEGRWTFSQNIVGLPRPRATIMHGAGPGAVRTAYWAHDINFDEIITAWQPCTRLAWRFSFTNSSLQNYTDKHIAPDGQFLKIDSGDYTLTPLSANTTLVTLHTRYIAKTHVNPYARLWGEILLGDIESNILAIIKHRAEAAHSSLN